jgi:hypothetical protein
MEEKKQVLPDKQALLRDLEPSRKVRRGWADNKQDLGQAS